MEATIPVGPKLARPKLCWAGSPQARQGIPSTHGVEATATDKSD
jgi:hypothetical protein